MHAETRVGIRVKCTMLTRIGMYEQISVIVYFRTASVVYWPEFLSTDLEVPGSIPGASRFSEKQQVWNGVHSAS
jgi:DNA topoisomerase IA